MFKKNNAKAGPKGKPALKGKPGGKPKASVKNKPGAKTKPSGEGKQIKVASKPKVVESKSSVVSEISLGNEIINLPVFSSSVDRNREIDAFIVDVLSYSDCSDVNPFFIGNYSIKSFDMYIKNSSQPTPSVDSNEVVNLKKKGV